MRNTRIHMFPPAKVRAITRRRLPNCCSCSWGYRSCCSLLCMNAICGWPRRVWQFPLALTYPLIFPFSGLPSNTNTANFCRQHSFLWICAHIFELTAVCKWWYRLPNICLTFNIFQLRCQGFSGNPQTTKHFIENTNYLFISMNVSMCKVLMVDISSSNIGRIWYTWVWGLCFVRAIDGITAGCFPRRYVSPFWLSNSSQWFFSFQKASLPTPTNNSATLLHVWSTNNSSLLGLCW